MTTDGLRQFAEWLAQRIDPQVILTPVGGELPRHEPPVVEIRANGVGYIRADEPKILDVEDQQGRNKRMIRYLVTANAVLMARGTSAAEAETLLGEIERLVGLDDEAKKALRQRGLVVQLGDARLTVKDSAYWVAVRDVTVVSVETMYDWVYRIDTATVEVTVQ